MARLTGKVAFFAGATTGIGAASAAMFAAEGARVIISGRRAAEGEAVAHGIIAGGGEAIFVVADVGDPAAIEHAIRTGADHFGRLDVMFANAGGSSAADGPVTTASLDEFWKKMQVDLFGVFLCSRFAIPEIIKSGGGSVINIASMVGFGTTTGRDAYSAAKGGVLTLTRSTARQYVHDKVRINAIAPAMVRTERVVKLLATVPDAKTVTAGQVLGLIEPEEIGHAAIFLASDESRSLTGQTIQIHGGMFD